MRVCISTSCELAVRTAGFASLLKCVSRDALALDNYSLHAPYANELSGYILYNRYFPISYGCDFFSTIWSFCM